MIPIDVLVIGTGAAGLGLALSLADRHHVAVLSKTSLMAGSSRWAQGGIAAVLNRTPTEIQSHIEDTLIAGAGLCHRDTVELVVNEAKDAIDWLVEHGVRFTMENGQYHLTREGGHRTRRILHVQDRTGSAVIETLADQVTAHPNITVFSDHTAVDLILDQQQCVGAWVLDNQLQQVRPFYASQTVLATGGASHCFLHTTNADVTSGDGIAMAWRAGCRVANLEFEQFHPTSLYQTHGQPFLISEAVRGEGGILKLPNGERFMARYDQRLELAPRDVVSRAIDQELKTHQLDYVLLDISHLPADKIRHLFPTIYAHCLKQGLDITTSPIPVVPAAHYTCGGIMTDHVGRTDLQNLYAIGEVAFTGLHGANRMASNSLLECVVFARRAAQSILANPVPPPQHREKSTPYQGRENIDPALLQQLRQKIRRIVWQHVGIVRSNQGLKQALNALLSLQTDIDRLFNTAHLTTLSIELRNVLITSILIVKCAQARHESRGLHFNVDFPAMACAIEDTILLAN